MCVSPLLPLSCRLFFHDPGGVKQKSQVLTFQTASLEPSGLDFSLSKSSNLGSTRIRIFGKVRVFPGFRELNITFHLGSLNLNSIQPGLNQIEPRLNLGLNLNSTGLKLD